MAVAAIAIAFIGLGVTKAAAQAPTLSVAVNGTAVSAQWTGVAGATGYNIVVTGAASIDVPLPASTTTAAANPVPAGTYTIRVRAFAGTTFGPFSNSVTVTVGPGGTLPPPGPCMPPTPPTANASTAGGVVTVTWNAVAGAAGYGLQFSRFPGGTELVQNVAANVTSYSQFVPLLGTFYVRVTVLTACGSATSAEVSFTIANQTSGSGPRTPDPPAGQLLPAPNYGQAVVIQMANTYPNQLRNSCHETGGNNEFMFLVLRALRQQDSRWGLNIKRGNQGLSQDVITYNPTNGPDSSATQIYLWDMIGNHCPISGVPTWNWTNVTQATWNAGAAGQCSNFYCARWTIDDYLRAGFQP
jgi:hypothetical protein